ncbi:MAG: deoxyguanosinetriphosphate triphosphohydrolase, partial [Rhodospirillaceae bacterium]
VFLYNDGENYRTRLTHSLEVAQIARSICRVLGLNEDLAEALALAHDLGHTCFGHAGETALKDCMAEFGGFDHNAQALRVVTKLEQKYAEHDGLNLTWECLEGLVKHNGPVLGPNGEKADRLPLAISEFDQTYPLELSSHAGPEAQVAALSDDIAYNAHDIEDGIRARLFETDAIEEVPLLGPILGQLRERYPKLETSRLIHETTRRLITAMVDDMIAETTRRIAAEKPDSVEAVRALGKPLVAFSKTMVENDKSLKKFLFSNMYRHYKVNRMTSKARRVVRDLFGLLSVEPGLMPPDWSRRCEAVGTAKTNRVVCDYIAGMTDRFALDEHARLFNPSVKP